MRSAGCALFPRTNGAAPPPAEACWEEGSEGEGSEGEGQDTEGEGEGSEGEGQGSDGQSEGSEDEEAEVCSPTPSTTPSPLSIYLHSHRAILTLALHTFSCSLTSAPDPCSCCKTYHRPRRSAGCSTCAALWSMTTRVGSP